MATRLASVKLDLLYHFHQIATQQSLKKAARQLYLTPPAVTHSLARLEQALGTRLARRDKSGFQLTEAGRRLFRSTERIVAELDEALTALGGEQDFTGVLSVGVLSNLVDQRTDDALDTLMRRHPSCRLNLRVTDPDDMNRLLHQGELHAGFGIFFKHLESLAYAPVSSQRLAYYISQRHPLWNRRRIARCDLAGQEVAWIDMEKRDAFSLETEVFGEHPRYRMKVVAYSNSLEGGLRLLLSGRAVVPLPVAFMARFMKSNPGLARRVNARTNAPIFPIECAYNRRAPMIAPLRDLLSLLEAGKPAPDRRTRKGSSA